MLPPAYPSPHLVHPTVSPRAPSTRPQAHSAASHSPLLPQAYGSPTSSTALKPCASAHRLAAVAKYLEKRKNRNFQKKVRRPNTPSLIVALL